MGKKQKLFEEDTNDDTEIKLNNDYASKYENWRRQEELNKSKARYLDIDNLDSAESSSSSDDDEADIEAAILDTEFFQTLSCLKNQDPRIYDQNVKFFKTNESNEEQKSKKTKQEKPVFLRDYERKILLENDGKIDESDEDQNIEEDPRSRSPTYVEEQKKIKDSLKKALEQDSDHENEANWGGMFKKREKTKTELAQEEKDYIKWLKGQKESLIDSNIENELKPLKDYWVNPKLDAGEKFLRDYILNKKFLDNEDANYIPSYEEIVHDSDDGLSEDGEAIRVQEEFETKYNYRFEEPDKEFIKRYPRTMEHSVRKKDDRRKQKRQELRDRKELDKLRKKEELQQVKAMKRKEIQEKIEKLKEITGNQDVGFNDEDIEGDFDPDEHDRRMQQLFNDEFYGGEEGDQKPEFPDIDNELEIENWDKWKGPEENEEYAPHCEDEDFNMDCDYDPTVSHQNEMIENSRNRRKRRKRSKFAEVVSTKKPAFDPNDKSYEEYLDDYYKLDYEDIIGDIPCRFKYRKVVPNDFGLSVEEILAAKDKELNKWCSLKKAVQIKPDHVEKYDVLAYKKKSQNQELKKKIFQSLYSKENSNENDEILNLTSTENQTDNSSKSDSHLRNDTESQIVNSKASIKKKKKLKSKNIDSSVQIHQLKNSELENNVESNEGQSEKKKKNKKRKHNTDNSNQSNRTPPLKKKKFNSEQLGINKSQRKKNNKRKEKKNKLNKTLKVKNDKCNMELTDARLKAFGLNPKKFKNKLKFANKNK